jgi:hypothetical protein
VANSLQSQELTTSKSWKELTGNDITFYGEIEYVSLTFGLIKQNEPQNEPQNEGQIGQNLDVVENVTVNAPDIPDVHGNKSLNESGQMDGQNINEPQSEPQNESQTGQNLDVVENVPVNVPVNIADTAENKSLNESSQKLDVVENVIEDVPVRLEKIIKIILNNSNITIPQLAKKLKVTSKTVKRDIVRLKEMKLIDRIGSDKTGHWVILKKGKISHDIN